MYIIYQLINNVNKKCYVGVTNNYEKRMRKHSYGSNDFLIGKAIRKYGWDNFTSTILFETDDAETAYHIAESHYIKIYMSNNPARGYNLTEGGQGTIGYKFSDESKQRMRETKLGRKLTEEHKRKIGEASKGHTLSPESRMKISIANKGKKFFLGKHLTQEAKDNLSKLKAKHWQLVSPDGEVVNIYNMRKFCIDNKLTHSAISKVLAGKRNHHKGWKAPHLDFSSL